MIFVLVGFLAQLIDGAIGMAYGVISSSLLLSLGVPPKVASASAKVARLFTTGVSGLLHDRLGSVNRALVLQLIVPGVIGGAAGVLFLTKTSERIILPVFAIYLAGMGLFIVYRAFRTAVERDVPLRLVVPLGLGGGFLDAMGGGWGAIVTSNLVALGCSPRHSVGTVNAAKFFVTLAQVAVFAAALQGLMWKASLGLIIGGLLAAPLAVCTCKRLPRKPAMIFVGVLVVVLGVFNLYKALQ